MAIFGAALRCGVERDTMMDARDAMKEVLTKSFWQGVKKTFYEAMEEAPPEKNIPQAPAEGEPKATSAPEKPSQSTTSE